MTPFDDIVKEYTRYVAEVSHPHHAVSLETAMYLWQRCADTRPYRVCDLGSGFSSWVLRHYAANAGYPVTVCSVDTDPEWLAKTAEFIGDDAGLLLWNEWLQIEDTYDLIFHDIANGGFREMAMSVAADRLNEGGSLVFDDAHHDGHRTEMVRVAERKGWRLTSLADVTTDSIGRYAMLATTDPPAPLEAEYNRLCTTPSDIVGHLPRFVEFVRLLEAQHVIELGTRTGVSTIAWLHGLNQTGGRLTSIDIDERPDIGEYSHWTYLQGSDMDPAIFDQLEPAEIVFIDTSHEYEHTVAELFQYRWLVKPGGIMVLHDTELPSVGVPTDPPYPVRSAIQKFVEATGYEWQEIPGSWGLGVIKL